MIYVLPLLAAQVFPGRFVEESLPKATTSVIETVILATGLNANEYATRKVLAKAFVSGTQDYSPNELQQTLQENFGSLRITAMPDHLRIRIVMHRDSTKAGLRLLDSLLRRPLLEPETLKETIDSMVATGPSIDPWYQALWPELYDVRKVTPKMVKDLQKRLVRPPSVSVVATGAFDPGTPRQQWLEMVQDWKDGFARKDLTEPILRATTLTGKATIVELREPVWAANSTQLATKVLGLFVLGAGKESLLFQTIRTKLGWSYRQEALLGATPEGFQTRILIGMLPSETDEERADAIRAALLDRIQNLSEDDRDRAMGMAASTLQRGILPLPFALAPAGQLGSEDKAFLMAYWPLKTGQPWNARGLINAMNAVKLEDLKKSLTETLQRSKSTVMSPRDR